MGERLDTDICVIGAGSGGLSVAAGAAQMGARTVLVEKGEMGGDCLNYGCVPSKALLAAAHAARGVRGAEAAPFGIAAAGPARVDMAGVRAHVREVIAAIAPNDSQPRFEGLGVTVLRAAGRFMDRRTLRAGETEVRARYFVIATGSRPLVPPIPGLDETPHHTNETIFDIAAPVDHLVIIGGGPIGLEIAQAHRRLGARVTVLEAATLMSQDDPEAAAVVAGQLETEGIELYPGTRVTGTAKTADGIAVTVEDAQGVVATVTGSHLLVAAGRRANVEALGLEAAGIEANHQGVVVDSHLRTANRRAFAIGDAAGGPQFTHMAGYHAGVVIRQALFKMLWARADDPAVPWVTYTDPELAQVGLREADAVARYGADRVHILRWPFEENDRAQAERATTGFVKVVLDRRGRPLGATIVGRGAGEMVLPWSLMIRQKLKIGAMAGAIVPYPTFSEASKRAAGSHFTPTLFSERTRRIVRFLLRF